MERATKPREPPTFPPTFLAKRARALNIRSLGGWVGGFAPDTIILLLLVVLLSRFENNNHAFFFSFLSHNYRRISSAETFTFYTKFLDRTRKKLSTSTFIEDFIRNYWLELTQRMAKGTRVYSTSCCRGNDEGCCSIFPNENRGRRWTRRLSRRNWTGCQYESVVSIWSRESKVNRFFFSIRRSK